MRSLADDLKLAHYMADAADVLCRRAFGVATLTTSKPDGSPVSAVDVEVERSIRNILREHRPDDAVFGEELSEGGAPLTADAVWIIDPLDHTRHFTRADPNYGVLIALMIGGIAEVAVVSAPSLAHRWSAARGEGANGDGKRLQTSRTPLIEQAHLALAGHREWVNGYDWRAVSKLMDQVGYLCGTPGGFYPAMQVAAGQLDAFVEPWGAVWDHAALALIVEEAGGRATTLTGTAPTGGSLLVSNRVLHDQLLDHFATTAPTGDAA